jgi:hypothetical protein
MMIVETLFSMATTPPKTVILAFGLGNPIAYAAG